MQKFGSEWDVYNEAISYLLGNGGEILCASPPAGTDPRFKKCVYPKPPKQGFKGLRDEVDVTAVVGGTLIVAEAKPALSHCLARVNRAGESDWDKLMRLAAIPTEEFVSRLSIAYGVQLNTGTRRFALAYHQRDAELPSAALGIWVRGPEDVVPEGQVPECLGD